MKILLFSSLFPNATNPQHGIFVENRLRHLLNNGGIEARVVAPVPWFPFKNKTFGKYAEYAKIPKHETHHKMEIEHPRFLRLPKIGMTIAPDCLYRTCLPVLKKTISNGYDFDVIDAHYFYPDGVAAVKLGEALNKPVVVTSRGSDINLLPQFKKPKQMIQKAAHMAAHLITVSDALRKSLIDLGVNANKITTLRNGVDLDTFKPSDRRSAREKYGMTRKSILSCGNLVKLKGNHLIIDAMKNMPDIDLYLAGDGPEYYALQSQAERLGLSSRVHFLGRLAHEALPELYSAADLLVLASSREGWPNVLLEAMACGTPVAATAVCGIPEVVCKPEAGLLIPERSVEAISATVSTLLETPPNKIKTRSYAEDFSWDETSRGQKQIFENAIK